MGFTHSLVGRDGFRLRGIEMSRVDGFSDVVFGFALTLLVASLEVPKTYDELHEVLLGFFPFAICFLFLMMVWLTHFRFFRRFGLHDLGTILINAGLLFTMLFYVYPLKFLFTLISAQFYGHGVRDPFRSILQFRELTVTYALGFTAIYFFLSLLNLHAWRLREQLNLNALELLILKSEVVDLIAVASVGLLVAVVGAVVTPAHAFAACYLFLLIGVWKTVSGRYFGKRIRAMRRAMVQQELALVPGHAGDSRTA